MRWHPDEQPPPVVTRARRLSEIPRVQAIIRRPGAALRSSQNGASSAPSPRTSVTSASSPPLQERAGSIPVLSAPPDHMRLGLQPSLAAQSRAPHIVEQLQRRDVAAQKMEDVSRMYGSAMAMRLKTERALCEQARAAQETPSLERAPPSCASSPASRAIAGATIAGAAVVFRRARHRDGPQRDHRPPGRAQPAERAPRRAQVQPARRDGGEARDVVNGASKAGICSDARSPVRAPVRNCEQGKLLWKVRTV